MKRNLTFLLTIALMLLCNHVWAQPRAEEVYSTCLFGSNYNQQSVSSYTATWTATNGDFSWTIVNGNNNNNNWNYVKFGRKNNASIGEIKTSDAYDQALIVTDPPRAGMAEKVVEQLLKIRAKKIVYVSCNPATQARDLQLLDPAYKVMAVQPVDMFPHTQHVENVCLLELRDL